MAADLQRQRGELERTNRLEAWADMARQVAHDIKNPLTPIQLSAEHLRRVHHDRGEPLSPVLDTCVDDDPVAGAAAAADLVGVLELRHVTGREAGAGAAQRHRRGSRWSRIAPASPAGVDHRDALAPDAAAGPLDRRCSAAR